MLRIKVFHLSLFLILSACDLAVSNDPVEDVTGCYRFKGPGYVDQICFVDDGTYTQTKSENGKEHENFAGTWTSLNPPRMLDGQIYIEMTVQGLHRIMDPKIGNYKLGNNVYIRPRQYSEQYIFFPIFDETHNELRYVKVIDDES